MRVVGFFLLAGLAAGAVFADASPAHAGCEVVGCYTAECWAIPGGRRCRRVCQRRCWNDAPRYYAPPPQPRYYAPTHQAVPQFNGIDIDPAGLAAAAVLAIVIIAIIAAIGASSDNSLNREITRIDASPAQFHAQADDWWRSHGKDEDYQRRQHRHQPNLPLLQT